MSYTKDDQTDRVVYTGSGTHAGIVMTIHKAMDGGEHYEILTPQLNTSRSWAEICATFEGSGDYLLD